MQTAECTPGDRFVVEIGTEQRSPTLRRRFNCWAALGVVDLIGLLKQLQTRRPHGDLSHGQLNI